jgi:ribose-phosphate pyrophosphokinase
MFPLQVMNLIGDVKGKVAVMVDDMIDTAGMRSSMHNLAFEQIFHVFFCI